MIDSDLATLYGLEGKVLNQAVRRNIERFPNDFMFQLTKEEWTNLRSQFVTASWGGRRNEPLVFAEHGVLMLSSVLNSQRAIQVNIRIPLPLPFRGLGRIESAAPACWFSEPGFADFHGQYQSEHGFWPSAARPSLAGSGNFVAFRTASAHTTQSSLAMTRPFEM